MQTRHGTQDADMQFAPSRNPERLTEGGQHAGCRRGLLSPESTEPPKIQIVSELAANAIEGIEPLDQSQQMHAHQLGSRQPLPSPLAAAVALRPVLVQPPVGQHFRNSHQFGVTGLIISHVSHGGSLHRRTFAGPTRPFRLAKVSRGIAQKSRKNRNSTSRGLFSRKLNHIKGIYVFSEHPPVAMFGLDLHLKCD